MPRTPEAVTADLLAAKRELDQYHAHPYAAPCGEADAVADRVEDLTRELTDALAYSDALATATRELAATKLDLADLRREYRRAVGALMSVENTAKTDAASRELDRIATRRDSAATRRARAAASRRSARG